MEISFRDAATVIHGMGFGALLLLLFSGAAVGLYAMAFTTSVAVSSRERRLLSGYLAVMAALGWIAVLIGAYVIYPWYRAGPPAGTIDLAGYPRSLLMSSPSTSGWHEIGMEWKEHFAWFAPMGLTAAAYICGVYGERLRILKGLRNAVVALVVLAFVATAVAGFFGAMLNKFAPVRGGGNITLMRGESDGTR
jgi:hypothetical protein